MLLERTRCLNTCGGVKISRISCGVFERSGMHTGSARSHFANASSLFLSLCLSESHHNEIAERNLGILGFRAGGIPAIGKNVLPSPLCGYPRISLTSFLGSFLASFLWKSAMAPRVSPEGKSLLSLRGCSGSLGGGRPRVRPLAGRPARLESSTDRNGVRPSTVFPLR